MQTGDGLLARLTPHEPLTTRQFSALCTAAEEHGNGIVEVSQRGSLQVRGLNEASAPKFAEIIASQRIGVGGPPLLTSPLLGFDSGEAFHSTDLPSALVSALLSAFEEKRPALQSLAPKVSVLLDGGGRLHLDALDGDIRLVAVAGASANTPLLQLSLAGTASTATHLGYVTVNQAPEVVTVLLEILANKGSAARARDLTQPIHHVRRSLASYLTEAPALSALFAQDRPCRPRADPVGTHELKDGTISVGFALPFGHTAANTLRCVIEAAVDQGVTSIRPAPGRALLAMPLSQSKADQFRRLAAMEGFIVEIKDPRRHVVTCAGAPACASAELPTRQLAAAVAAAAAKWAGTSKVVHLAGCTKGCAHPGPSALTIVGPNRIVLNGRANDPPAFTFSAAGLIADVTRLCGDTEEPV
jgi:precorrin-3B synthase